MKQITDFFTRKTFSKDHFSFYHLTTIEKYTIILKIEFQIN